MTKHLLSDEDTVSMEKGVTVALANIDDLFDVTTHSWII